MNFLSHLSLLTKSHTVLFFQSVPLRFIPSGSRYTYFESRLAVALTAFCAAASVLSVPAASVPSVPVAACSSAHTSVTSFSLFPSSESDVSVTSCSPSNAFASTKTFFV